MPDTQTQRDPQAILDFWRQAGPEKWFRKDDAFDADFKSRFEAAHHAAARGELDAWMNEPNGALALVLLLDQLPRNAWRGSGHMFATDGKARQVARHAVESGLDRQIEDVQLRAFFYLPFMHSEELSDLDRCVALCGTIPTDNLKFAEHHRDIIRRFGRFPHRNAALGRESTPEEQRFLAEGGFSG
ncbi:DUF924 family protein [Variovorax dokdonensis]|uniref:DUF924 family protein n=1 Tax=Variovorax dokdonensis TaxID=344883 RepID=A0ABT7NEC1_9BURK|nr:DUF924 family protein [Variovorax dokdonensis]MDM0046294.1 DUF924 family protein [Variovorax dokdonensis]